MSDDTPVQQQLEILKIYLKDASLECPGAPQIFNEQGQPQINVQLGSGAFSIAPDVHEVVLTLTVTAKVNDKTAYLIEVQQAGLFGVRGFDQQQLGHVLGSFCPATLFPFARETLATCIGKAGFPALYLNPVNFDALYMQRLQQEQQTPQTDTQH